MRAAVNYQGNNRNGKAELCLVVIVLARCNDHSKKGISDRRQCNTGTGYPGNLQNPLREVFKIRPAKIWSHNPMFPINPLLKVALCYPQNFHQKRVYNLPGFELSSLRAIGIPVCCVVSSSPLPLGHHSQGRDMPGSKTGIGHFMTG